MGGIIYIPGVCGTPAVKDSEMLYVLDKSDSWTLCWLGNDNFCGMRR